MDATTLGLENSCDEKQGAFGRVSEMVEETAGNHWRDGDKKPFQERAKDLSLGTC